MFTIRYYCYSKTLAYWGEWPKTVLAMRACPEGKRKEDPDYGRPGNADDGRENSLTRTLPPFIDNCNIVVGVHSLKQHASDQVKGQSQSATCWISCRLEGRCSKGAHLYRGVRGLMFCSGAV